MAPRVHSVMGLSAVCSELRSEAIVRFLKSHNFLVIAAPLHGEGKREHGRIEKCRIVG